MEIEIITNKADWDGWLLNNTDHQQFSQSWDWGEILLAEGKQIDRLALLEKGKVIKQVQLVYNQLPFGWKYAFSPKGGAVNKEIIDYLRKKGCIFYRLEPKDKLDNNYPVIETIDINPRATVILGLNKTENELLQAMKAKTRYNIGLAKRKDLQVIQEKNLAGFIKISNQTAKRDKFNLHPVKHYEKILNSKISYQLSVKYQKKIIATNVWVAFGNTFTYLYGASDYKYRKLMAPYLLQWQGIKLAKERGCQYYDLFGIAPKIDDQPDYNYNQNHQYAGVTRFKLGFGGQIYQDPGTFDVVINKKKYKFYQFLRKLRRLV